MSLFDTSNYTSNPGLYALMTAVQPPGFAAAISLSVVLILFIYVFQLYYDSTTPNDPTDPSQIYNNLELRVDASQEEIRLLYLHPGDWEDELTCTLKAVELGNNPHYVALSYAWRENYPAVHADRESVFGYVSIYSWWTMLMPKGTRKKLIKVNNGNLGIGKNLELALRHMRSLPGGPSIAVFADAICINQSDLQDRSSQVTLLREIYRKAARVEIWLGAEKELGRMDEVHASPVASRSNLSLGSTCSAQTTIRPVGRREDESETSSSDGHQHQPNFELEFDTYEDDHAQVSACIDDWYQYYSRPKLFRTNLPPNYTLGFFSMIWLLSYDAFKTCGSTKRASLTKRVPFLSDPTRKATLEVFSELMHRVWWNRLWVLQEVTIASELVVRYGRFVIPWEMLSRASKNILHHMHHTCCAIDFEKLGRSDLELLQSYAHKIAALDRWRSRWNRDAESSAPRISLLRLMRKFRDRETSNPRDKVYALLPLVNYWGRPKVNVQMVANYDLSVADVFKKAGKTLLSMEESLDVLVGSTGRTSKAKMVLPSWVPDWSATSAVNAMVERTELYRASRNTTLQFRTFEKNAYLELRGIHHDTVTLVGEAMPHDAHGNASPKAQAAFQAWKKLARLEEEGGQDYHECIHTNKTGRPESKSLAFVRTMCMDSIHIDGEDDGYDLEASSQCYERASPSFRDSVDGWCDPLRDHSDVHVESGGGLIRALPITNNLVPGLEEAEDLLKPLDRKDDPGHREAFSMDKAVETATMSRRFFITSRGYMGLGPEEMQKGDHVFVLFGGSIPFVLRDAGKRQIPGLDIRRHKMRASRAEQGLLDRGREGFRGISSHMEVWSGCSSTSGSGLKEDGNRDPPVAEEVVARADFDRSRSASTSQSGRQRCPPNGRFVNDVNRCRAAISLQTEQKQTEGSSRKLSQCYELIGDCFVHGIMDGEATYRVADGKEEALEPQLVYLV